MSADCECESKSSTIMGRAIALLFVCAGFYQTAKCVCIADHDAPFRSDGSPGGAKILLKHFWKSTGLSPPDPMDVQNFLLSADEKFNLALIGSLPHYGIRQVRIHWLINLISYNKTAGAYDFTNLDALLDFMHGSSLRPGFELMGLPQNLEPTETKSNVYRFWFNLVETIAHRYIARFGFEEVQTWRFETMNEPDLKQYNFLNFTLPEYLQYFKACTDALHNVSNTHSSAQRQSASKQRRGQNESIELRRRTTAERNARAPDVHNQLMQSLPSAMFPQANETIEAAAPSQGATISERRSKSESAANGRAQRGGTAKRKMLAAKRAKGTKAIKAHALKIGGPAGLFKRRERHPLCWGMLDMCNRTECHLHYVSFHKKGEGSAGQVLSADLRMLDQLQEYGFMQDMPVANDEADILTNWSLDESWRGDVWYAALMSKVIIDHYVHIILKKNVTIEVLSNDNAFLNYHPFYFTQRTLLARFQMNNTTPRHVQFIKKPVHIAMGLLAMIGDEFLPTGDCKINNRPNLTSTVSKDDDINVLYTKRASKYADVLSILIVAVTDPAKHKSKPKTYRKRDNHRNVTLEINLDHIFEALCDCANTSYHESSPMMIYALDNEQTNPHQVWESHKSPYFPDKELRRLMRQNEGPVTQKVELLKRRSTIHLSVKMPSIHLINICVAASKNAIPGAVINLRGYYVTQNEVLLTWSDNIVRSRCIKTYEVEYRAHPSAHFKRINDENLILLTYQHDGAGYSPAMEECKNGQDCVRHASNIYEEKIVQYRVRAVDYWDRPGPYSNAMSSHQIIHL